mgnify:CR=1 FL=1
MRRKELFEDLFLKKDNEKPLILVLTGGSPIAIPEIHEIADAILFVW